MRFSSTSVIGLSLTMGIKMIFIRTKSSSRKKNVFIQTTNTWTIKLSTKIHLDIILRTKSVSISDWTSSVGENDWTNNETDSRLVFQSTRKSKRNLFSLIRHFYFIESRSRTSSWKNESYSNTTSTTTTTTTTISHRSIKLSILSWISSIFNVDVDVSLLSMSLFLSVSNGWTIDLLSRCVVLFVVTHKFSSILMRDKSLAVFFYDCWIK